MCFSSPTLCERWICIIAGQQVFLSARRKAAKQITFRDKTGPVCACVCGSVNLYRSNTIPSQAYLHSHGHNFAFVRHQAVCGSTTKYCVCRDINVFHFLAVNRTLFFPLPGSVLFFSTLCHVLAPRRARPVNYSRSCHAGSTMFR